MTAIEREAWMREHGLHQVRHEDDSREPGALFVGLFWATVFDCFIVAGCIGLWHLARHL